MTALGALIWHIKKLPLLSILLKYQAKGEPALLHQLLVPEPKDIPVRSRTVTLEVAATEIDGSPPVVTAASSPYANARSTLAAEL